MIQNSKNSKINKAAKLISRIVIIIFLVIAILTMLSLLGIPKQLRIFVVETGSMEPNIPTGSLIFSVPQDSYYSGDIITFNQQQDVAGAKTTPITHRIDAIKLDNGIEEFVTKGDANRTPDANVVTKDNIIGKVIFHIPFIGLLINFAKTQIGFLVVIIIPTIIIIYSELLNIKKEFLRLRSKKNDTLVVNPEVNV